MENPWGKTHTRRVELLPNRGDPIGPKRRPGARSRTLSSNGSKNHWGRAKAPSELLHQAPKGVLRILRGAFGEMGLLPLMRSELD